MAPHERSTLDDKMLVLIERQIDETTKLTNSNPYLPLLFGALITVTTIALTKLFL